MIKLSKDFHMFLWFDHVLWYHVVLNLLSNSAEYSAGNFLVKVILSYDSNILEISVMDHYIGIPKERIKWDIQIIWQKIECFKSQWVWYRNVHCKKRMSLYGAIYVWNKKLASDRLLGLLYRLPMKWNTNGGDASRSWDDLYKIWQIFVKKLD